MLGLSSGFFMTALLYATVGFGGGSTYNALLVLADVSYRIIPLISLICNIIVVTGGVWHFYRGWHLNFSKVLPWIVFSVPASFAGGLIPVPEYLFTGILGLALTVSGIRLLWPEKTQTRFSEPISTSSETEKKYLPAVLGLGLGFIAGITGIGGGIFLAPLLHFLRWGHAKEIAGACAFFILVNSFAGLAGQIIKGGYVGISEAMTSYWLLFPAVLIGGQIGSWTGSSRLNLAMVKKATGVLVLYVAVKLIIKFIKMLA